MDGRCRSCWTLWDGARQPAGRASHRHGAWTYELKYVLLRRVACPAVRVFRVDGGAIGRGDGTEEVLKFRLMRRFPRCRNIEVFGLAVRSPLVRVTIGAGDYELDLHPRGTPLTRVAGYCAAYATGPDPFFRVLPSLVLDLSRSITSVETRERRGGSL